MQPETTASDFRFSARPRLRWLLTLLVLLAGAGFAVLANRLPAPAPETAPATEFSAGRAMKDVRAVATRPHPIGSPEIDETRNYLVARMAAMGLDPRVRDQTSVVQRRTSADLAIGGRVRNIIGEIRGTDPALPAVLVMAHYDTAPLSPGAGDDTSGIAVALEVARALKAAPPLPRSVLFLFTDGEEAGLLGATAFFESDPLRRRAGVVINLEARGDSGKALMFQTSAGNRTLIDIYRHNVSSPAADSLMVTIYEHMPNDTDLTPALARGYAGMNFAFVGHQLAYHTPLSTPESLNVGSIQHMGDQVLPVVRAFAAAKTPAASGEEMVFADLFGQHLINYPSSLGWILAIATIGSVFVIVAAAIARRRTGWRDVLAGMGGMLTLLLGIATVLMLEIRIAAFLLRDVASPYAVVGQLGWLLPATILLGLGTGALLLHVAARGGRGRAALVLAGAGTGAALLGEFNLLSLLLGITAAIAAFASLGRRAAPTGWFAGGVALIAILALPLQIFLPNGAHALIWPLLLLVPGLALLLFSPAQASRPAGLAAIALFAALIAGLMARSAYDFFVMVGVSMPAVTTPFLMLTLLALVPLLWSLRGLQHVGGACVAAGLALCVVAGFAGRTPTARSPEMVEAFYLADADTGRANWVSGKLDRSGWVATALAQDGGTARQAPILPFAKEEHWVARAQSSAFARPRLAMTVTGEDESRILEIDAANANGGRYMRIFIKPSVDMSGLRLMGRPVSGTLKAGEWTQLIFHASGTGTVRLTIAARGASGRVEAKLLEVRDAWPEGAGAKPMPAYVIPYRRAGSSMIVAGTTAQW